MLKILQARLQQYMNQELPDAQAGFRKARRTRDQIANIHWIIEKARKFQKNIYFMKAFDSVDYNKLWKIRRDGNTRPPYLPLEKSVQVKKQQLERDMEWQTGSKLEKEYIKAVYCHRLFNLYAEDIMWNAGLDEAQAGMKIAERNMNNLRYAADTTLVAESKGELKSLLKVKEESEKAVLKLSEN